MLFIELFKYMSSIPRTSPLTKTEMFTQWSSLLAYVLAGAIFFLAPQLLTTLLQMEVEGRSVGYLRLSFQGVTNIGICLVFAGRSNHKITRHLVILASVITRLLVVNGIMLMMILRNMVHPSFAMFYMILDTALALITLLIWYSETEGASASLFFRQVFVPIFQGRALKEGASIAVAFCIGTIGIFFWITFVIRPDLAQQLFHLDPFESYSGGYLACVFFVLAIVNWLHVTGSSSVDRCLIPTFIYHRIMLNVPTLLYLFLAGQIEGNLFRVLVISNVLPAVIISISVFLEEGNKTKKR